MPDAPLSSYLTPRAEALRPRWYRICFASSYRMRPCRHAGKYCLLGTLLLLVLRSRSAAQTDQLLPEVDVYYKVFSPLRIWLQAKETREDGSPATAEIGPSFDFYVKSPLGFADITTFDLDDSKSRLLVVSVGYRYLPTPNTARTNRFEPFFVLNYPIAKLGLLMSDRNRADLDWKSGNFTWRYRNRIQLERTLRASAHHPSAYASAEFYYSSQYQQVERHRDLRRMPLSHWQALRTQSVLRAPEQHRQKSQSAVQPVRPHAQSILRPEMSNSERFAARNESAKRLPEQPWGTLKNRGRASPCRVIHSFELAASRAIAPLQ